MLNTLQDSRGPDQLRHRGGSTSYEYICKIWTTEPDRFILKARHVRMQPKDRFFYFIANEGRAIETEV
jgi:hypothetical protein